MGRVHFHTPTAAAALAGAEYAWLSTIALGPAAYAWNTDGDDDHIAHLLAMIDPATRCGASLHTAHTAALAEYDTNRARPTHEQWTLTARTRLRTDLRLTLPGRADPAPLLVAGQHLDSHNVSLNTALTAGSPPVALAAKLTGWCASHTYIEGPDRAWAADIIDTALDAGIYRRTLRDHDLGWPAVTALLRAADDEPAVTSYTGGSTFPNREIAGAPADPLPDAWAPEWASTVDGRAEWAAMDDDRRAETRADAAGDRADTAWYDRTPDDRFTAAMTGLRTTRPWARLAPDTLHDVMFGPPVTVYDLLAPDADTRVTTACTKPPYTP